MSMFSMREPLWSLIILMVMPVTALVRAMNPSLSPEINTAATKQHHSTKLTIGYIITFNVTLKRIDNGYLLLPYSIAVTARR